MFLVSNPEFSGLASLISESGNMVLLYAKPDQRGSDCKDPKYSAGLYFDHEEFVTGPSLIIVLRHFQEACIMTNDSYSKEDLTSFINYVAENDY